MTSIIGIISSVVGIVAAVLAYRNSANRQRRSAEADVAKAEAKKAATKAEIERTVYEGSDDDLNQLVHRLLPVVGIVAALVAGCAAQPPRLVYVPTDRRIESCTNSFGIACKAVPDAVMVEMLEGLAELKALKTERAVNERLGK